MFRFEYMSLTQLGQVFGVSNQQVGKWLVELGLRTNENKPSYEAFDGAFVEQMPSRNQGYTWAWHSAKTVAALETAGHLRVLNVPSELIESPTLNGPFWVRSTGDSTHQIVSADGGVAIFVNGERNALFVRRLLNTAHKAGVIERHLSALAV